MCGRWACGAPVITFGGRSAEGVSAGEQTLPLIAAIARKIPPRHDYLPRMCRAAASKVLNTAEGAAELSPGDKARFYRMAHRSTAELAAILRLLDALQIVTMPEIGSADPTCNGSASCSSG